MPRSTLSRIGRPRSRTTQQFTEGNPPPLAGERDGVTYGETKSLAELADEAKPKATKAEPKA